MIKVSAKLKSSKLYSFNYYIFTSDVSLVFGWDKYNSKWDIQAILFGSFDTLLTSGA